MSSFSFREYVSNILLFILCCVLTTQFIVISRLYYLESSNRDDLKILKESISNYSLEINKRLQSLEFCIPPPDSANTEVILK